MDMKFTPYVNDFSRPSQMKDCIFERPMSQHK